MSIDLYDAAPMDEAQVAIVKGMLNRGDHVLDIAACLGVHPHFVRAVQAWQLFPSVVPAPAMALPAAAKYAIADKATKALTDLAVAEDNLRAIARHRL